MKKWLLLITLTGLLALGAAACNDGGDGDEPQPSPTPLPVADGGPNSQAACAPGFPDCNDTIVVGDGEANPDDAPPLSVGDNVPIEEPLPLAPDDAVPGPVGYRVTISFNTSYDQADLDDVGDRIRDFDPDADYVIQESFPPTGVANVVAETEDFCLAIVPELESLTFVTSASCGPQLEPGDIVDGDAPVSTTPLPLP